MMFSIEWLTNSKISLIFLTEPLAKWEFGILVAEALIVLGILVAELYGISLERKNHALYKSFFEERTRWYMARGKSQKPTLAKSVDSAESSLNGESIGTGVGEQGFQTIVVSNALSKPPRPIESPLEMSIMLETDDDTTETAEK